MKTFTVNITTREQQLLDCLADGLQDKEIAAKLHISLSTVKHSMSRLRMKSGLEERSGARALVAWAFRNRLVK